MRDMPVTLERVEWFASHDLLTPITEKVSSIEWTQHILQ